MTNTKHTPGPWQNDGPEIKAPCFDESWNASIPPSKTYMGVAGVYDTGTDGEMEANARLISAAPELLAACKKALEVVDTMEGLDRLGIILADAIAKAEGREG